MKESQIERSCTRIAKDAGWLSFKFSSPSNRGVPDRIFISNVTWYVEFKAPGGRLSKLQSHVINKIRRAGAIVDVIDNTQTFTERLAQISAGNN